MEIISTKNQGNYIRHLSSLSTYCHSKNALLTVYFSAVFFVCYYPLLISSIFNIWPPLTMFQEVFSTNYSAYLLTKKYQFIETGYGFLVVFDFPVTALVDMLWSKLDNYAKFNLFSQLLYLYHGTVLFVIYVLIYRSRLLYINKIILLFIPLAALCIEKVTNFNLIINYCKAEEVSYLLLAALCMKYIYSKENSFSNTKSAILFGLFAGFIVSIKFSLSLVAVPILFALLIPFQNIFKGLIKNGIVFSISMFAALALIFLLYNHFDLDHFQRFLHETVQLYKGVWLRQDSPFLLHELNKYLQFESYYLGLQLMIALVASLIAISGIYVFLKRSVKGIILLSSFILPFLVLIYMFHTRTCQGTMIDISIFTTFAIVVLSALISKLQFKKASYIIACLIVIIFLASIISFEPRVIQQNLTINSNVARDFQKYIDDGQELQTIYYMPEIEQSLLFPSADLLGLYKALGSSHKNEFIAKYYPRSELKNLKKLSSNKHIAIIPEYVDLIPKTPLSIREWPNMPPPFSMAANYPLLLEEINQRATNCRIFQFKEIQNRKQLLYYSVYPTKVTACILTSGNEQI